MLIFVTTVVGPALGFMTYTLTQLWREASRERRNIAAIAPSGSLPCTAATIDGAEARNARKFGVIGGGLKTSRGTAR